eukprot:scaffold212366_cov37-Tisochrysis_lutea.AAC.2
MLTCGEKLKQISVTCLNTPLYMSTPQHVLSRAELCSQMLDAPSLPFQHFVHHGYICISGDETAVTKHVPGIAAMGAGDSLDSRNGLTRTRRHTWEKCTR